MPRTIAICLCLTVALHGLHAADPTLDYLKQTYESEVQKLRNQHDENLEKLFDAYGNSLDRAIEILKKEGDPDRILEAIAEKRRFENEKTVPHEPDAKLPDVIQQIQSGYNDALKRANIGKERKFVELTERYVAALDKLMRSFAADGKLDLSLNVKMEKERVKFVLADVESKLSQMSRELKPLTPALRRGLVLWLPFSRNEGHVVSDESGNENHGIVCGAKWAGNGQIDGAYVFDGGQAHIEVPDSSSLDMANQLTIAFWMNLRNIGDWREVVGKSYWNSGYKDTGYLVKIHGSHIPERTHKLVFEGTESGSETTARFRLSRQRVQTGWHHYAVTFCAKGGVTFYVDGAMDSQHASNIGRLHNSNRPLMIGKGKSTDLKNGNRAIDGLLDEVMIWNRALSATEVKQIYKLTGGK